MVPVLFRLRGLANGYVRERRDAQSKTRPAARTLHRRGRRHYRLPAGDLCLLARAGRRRPGEHNHSRIRGDAPGAWANAAQRLIACGIAISTVGFLSQSILTAPRVYYAMARDGVFFQAVGRLNPRTRVPVVAIVLQGVWAAVVAMTGRYEQILNYVVTIDVLFFGLTGASLLVFRARARRAEPNRRRAIWFECRCIRSRRGCSCWLAGAWPSARSCGFRKTPASASRFLASEFWSIASGRRRPRRRKLQISSPKAQGNTNRRNPRAGPHLVW